MRNGKGERGGVGQGREVRGEYLKYVCKCCRLIEEKSPA